tara:strand:- start:525 stop:791 length:267 start_codon:yes stop_codon:yes gene_type:complete
MLELISFLVQAAFVYGLVLIAGILFIVHMINDGKSKETIVEYVTVVEMHEVTKFVEKGPELTCIKLSGCKINVNAKTEEEYCPTCIMK